MDKGLHSRRRCGRLEVHGHDTHVPDNILCPISVITIKPDNGLMDSQLQWPSSTDDIFNWNCMEGECCMPGVNQRDYNVGTRTSYLTGVQIVYSTVCSGADQRNHQSSASLAFVRGMHRWPVNSPHRGQYRGKCFDYGWVQLSEELLESLC